MRTNRVTPVPAATVQKNFGFYQDEAARAPVLISRDGRPGTVLLSIDEYDRLAARDRRAYGLDDLPPAIRSAILDAGVPDGLEEA